MKVFLSSTYLDLIEHRIIPAGGKAAHGEYHPRIKPRIREWRGTFSFIREIFVDGTSPDRKDQP